MMGMLQPRVEVGGANAADERGPREREDVSWTEELIRAVKNPLLGELVDDATDEADPPEVRQHLVPLHQLIPYKSLAHPSYEHMISCCCLVVPQCKPSGHSLWPSCL